MARVAQNFIRTAVNLASIRRGMRAAQILCLAALAGSCELWPDGEFPPGGAERIAERPEYVLWWKLVEDCAGRRRRMNVQWYSTNGELIQSGDALAAGLFRPYPDRIALIDPSDGPVARHEMLHAILERDGHPLDFFAARCGGIVDFKPPANFGTSEADQATAVPTPIDSALRISIRTIPETPSQSLFGGKFVFVAEMTNRTNKYVRVTPGPDPELFVQYVDSVRVRRVASIVSPDRFLYFAPGQTRRVILDATVFNPGSYNAIAGYGRARSATTRLVLHP